MARISWDEYFMSMAVGAVIVRDNQVLSTGYNGAPKGLPNCCDLNECLRQKLGIPSGERHELCRAVHAEANAITQCAVNGTSCKGSTLYYVHKANYKRRYCSYCSRRNVPRRNEP